MIIKFMSQKSMDEFFTRYGKKELRDFIRFDGTIVVDRIESIQYGVFWDIGVKENGRETVTIASSVGYIFFDIIEE